MATKKTQKKLTTTQKIEKLVEYSDLRHMITHLKRAQRWNRLGQTEYNLDPSVGNEIIKYLEFQLEKLK